MYHPSAPRTWTCLPFLTKSWWPLEKPSWSGYGDQEATQRFPFQASCEGGASEGTIRCGFSPGPPGAPPFFPVPGVVRDSHF